jgi:hypothetical protein
MAGKVHGEYAQSRKAGRHHIEAIGVIQVSVQGDRGRTGGRSPEFAGYSRITEIDFVFSVQLVMIQKIRSRMQLAKARNYTAQFNDRYYLLTIGSELLEFSRRPPGKKFRHIFADLVRELWGPLFQE